MQQLAISVIVQHLHPNRNLQYEDNEGPSSSLFTWVEVCDCPVVRQPCILTFHLLFMML